MMELFFTFVKIGLFTFGGGYAMISMIENNCVEKKACITHDEMMDVTVIAESTPGPIAINCATFTGYKKIVKTNYDMFVCYNVMYQCFCLEFFIY